MSKNHKEAKQEVAVVETTKELSTHVEPIEGAEEEILTSMIKLPRLSLQQKMSKPVENELAKVGDLFENLGNTVVCPKDQPFVFIPLKLRNVITTYLVEGQKKTYVSQVPRTKKNEKDEWDSKGPKGEIYKNLPETIVYMLAAKDLEEGNPTFPYVFTFRGASMPKGGKSIYTNKLLLDSSMLPFYSYKFRMTSSKEEKDNNTFQVAHVERLNEKLDPKHFETCKRWIATIETMKVEVTEDDEINTEAQGASVVTKEQF